MCAKNISAAFTELYNATYKRLFAFVYAKISDTESVDDLLQTIYTSFYKRLISKGIPSEEESLKILYTAAKHELGRSYGEMNRKIANVHIDDEDFSQKLEQELSLKLPDPMSDDEFLLQEIWDKIEEKGEMTKRLFVLHFHMGYTLEETAKLMEITPSMATSRIYRTIKELKKLYSKGGVGYDSKKAN